MNIDLSSMACLSALAILVPELKDLQEPQQIIKMRDDCHDWLANNCRVNENVSDRQGYREKALSVLHFVHEVSFRWSLVKMSDFFGLLAKIYKNHPK